MRTWFDKKFSSVAWWETRLRNVASLLGLEISEASCYFAHRGIEFHTNWRCSRGWITHLDYITRYGVDF